MLTKRIEMENKIMIASLMSIFVSGVTFVMHLMFSIAHNVSYTNIVH